MRTLYLPPHPSATKASLAGAAQARGIEAIDFRAPEDLMPGAAYAFGGPKFMARLSRVVDLAALEPTDDWLPSLPWRFRRRAVDLIPLSEAREKPGRVFVKAPREKDFEAGIYTGAELPLDAADPPVLVSDIVTFTREYRLLVLDGQVRTGSRYFTAGRPDLVSLVEDADNAAVVTFADALLDAVADTLPSAVTVDVGWAAPTDGGEAGWAVVEANMAWFSNIYACNPDHALDVVMRAAGPVAALADRDRAFVREGGGRSG